MEAKLLAGGQTFIPVLKQRLNKPSAIIDLNKAGLAGITAAADKITIGAMLVSQYKTGFSLDAQNCNVFLRKHIFLIKKKNRESTLAKKQYVFT